MSANVASQAAVLAETRADTRVNFGFWIYLMSDVIIFSMLFMAYLDLSTHFAGGPTGHEMLHLHEVFIETMALLFSSITYGFAVISLQRGNKNGVMAWLAVTFVLGACFIGLELHEFVNLVHEGASFTRSAYWSAFFSLVGTHGTHVSFGLLWILVMIVQLAVKGINPQVASRLMRLSMFWHFLDVVWIGVFSTVYLPQVL